MPLLSDDSRLHHAYSVESAQIVQLLQVDPALGLAAQEVHARQEQFGANSLPQPPIARWWQRLARQLHSVLIYALLLAALVTALLGHWIDSAVIVAVVLINSVIGLIQEGKAERALEAISQLLSSQARVLRAGVLLTVEARQLVPGDIVLLQSGDKVPADLRLLSTRSLQIDESALSGESLASEKSTTSVLLHSPLAERCGMAYSGTVVTYGQGLGVVVAIGAASEIGRISQLMATVKPMDTGLLRALNRFAQRLTAATAAVAVLTFVYGWWQGYPLSALFLMTVSLAVAVIPEGLPAIMTIILAVGVQRMAKRNAIIRHLPSVETLGAVSVICSDKTGTLTCNAMTVRAVVSAETDWEVQGSGYAPQGGFLQHGQLLSGDLPSTLQEIAWVAALCNDAYLSVHGEQWRVDGDPMEGALLSLAGKAGLELTHLAERWPRSDVIPFESEHRFMATLNHDHTGQQVILLKGAPERVLQLCTQQRTADGGSGGLDVAYWHTQQQQLAAQGQRLLALAIRRVPHELSSLQFSEIESAGFVLLGLLGIYDPPRPEAIRAIARCQQAGITVKMVTGDHVSTAQAIGLALGLRNAKALTGQQLDQLSPEQWPTAVAEHDIFARVTPSHKLRLVKALQAQGALVAMTGDGVNDAPALKQADIGVAMGQNGTEAAKQAADMILADDHFSTISHAVEEGRGVYANLQKAIMHMLPTNGGQALMMLLPILLGESADLPITPTQILWVNMVCVVALSLSLAMEPVERTVLNDPPRRADASLLSGFLLWRVLFITVLLAAGCYALYHHTLSLGHDLHLARTVTVNALVFGQMFYLFNCRYLQHSILSWQGLMGNPYVLLSISGLIGLQLLFTYSPWMHTLFATEALHAPHWLAILGFGLGLFLVVELEKWVVRRWVKPQQGA